MRLVGLAVMVGLLAGSAQAQGGGTEIRVGMCGPLTGTSKELGLQMKLGIEAAFAAANDAGGVGGRKLAFTAADDGYDPARVVGCMKDLVEKHHVVAFVGNVGAAPAGVTYANEQKVVLFGSFSGAPWLRNDPPDRYIFNYRASYAEETAVAVKHLVDVRRVDAGKIAVFAQDDALGQAGFDGVATAMRKLKRDPAKAVRVGYKRGTTDVEDAVKTLKKAGAAVKAVVMVSTYKAAARFIEKCRDAGLDLAYANVSFVGSNELADELTQLGARYAEGVIVTQVVPLPTSQATTILRFKDEVKKYAPSEKPGFISLEGWLAGQLFIEGLKRAGATIDSNSIVSGLEGVKSMDMGIGVPLSFGPSEHQASHRVWVTVLDGKGGFSIEHE